MGRFFKNKSIGGFYLPAVSVVLSIIMAIEYTIGFTGTVYLSALVAALPLVASVLFVLLSLTKWATPFASLVAGVLQFVSLLLFLATSYMFLSEAFYGGVSLGAIIDMNAAWLVTLVILLVNVIVCNIGIYKKQEKKGAV